MRLPPAATTAVRYAITASMLYGAYIAYTCPCQTVMSCHQQQFYAAAGAPIFITALLNNM